MKPSDIFKKIEAAHNNIKALHEDYQNMVKGRIFNQRFNKYVEEARYYIDKLKIIPGTPQKKYLFRAKDEKVVNSKNLIYYIWLPAEWSDEDIKKYIKIMCLHNKLIFDQMFKINSIVAIKPGEIKPLETIS